MPTESRLRRQPFSRLRFIIASYVYIALWIVRANIRANYGKYFQKGAGLVLGLFFVTILVEIVLERMGRKLASSESLTLQAIFFLAIAIVFWGKMSEWREDREEVYFAGTASKVVEVFSQADAAVRDPEVITDLLALFRGYFESKGVVNCNVAMPRDGGLRVQHVYPPDSKYDDQLVLREGTGGSGVCYADQCVVYIPSIHYRHAVVEDLKADRPYTLLPDCYESSRVEGFQSILCAPIVIYGNRYGVLNFDSASRNMFNIRDFAQARFFAFVLAQYLHDTKDGRPASKDRG